MNKLTLFALGLAATGTVAALRILPTLVSKRKEKAEYDAEVNTWEGEGGSLDRKAPNVAAALPPPRELAGTAPLW